LNCDICGRQIHGAPNRVVVEGAVMTTCPRCVRLGTPYQEPKPAPAVSSITAPRPVPHVRPRPTPSLPADRRVPREVQELDVADNYSQIIQKARRKHDFTQEDLAIKVKERLSIIQKIEAGKMVPDMRLAKTLEHVLRVKLLVPRIEPSIPKTMSSPTKEITLADVARVRKKDGLGVSELEV